MVLSKPKNLTSLWHRSVDDENDDKHWLYLPTLAGVKYVEVWTHGRGRSDYHWKVSRSSGRHSSGKNVTFDVAKSEALAASQKSRTNPTAIAKAKTEQYTHQEKLRRRAIAKKGRAIAKKGRAADKAWYKALPKRSSTRDGQPIFKGRSPSNRHYEGLDWSTYKRGGIRAERHGVEFEVNDLVYTEVYKPSVFGAWWSLEHQTMIFLQANYVGAVLDYWKIKTKVVCDLLLAEYHEPGCEGEITGTGERWEVDIEDFAQIVAAPGKLTWEKLLDFANDANSRASKTDSWSSPKKKKRSRR